MELNTLRSDIFTYICALNNKNKQLISTRGHAPLHYKKKKKIKHIN